MLTKITMPSGGTNTTTSGDRGRRSRAMPSNAGTFCWKLRPTKPCSKWRALRRAATTCGGQSLRYLRDHFSQVEVATEKVVPGFSAYDSMEKQAESVPLGSDGLLVLPYLMGERTPLWDVHARGVIFGLSLNHTEAHLVRRHDGRRYLCDVRVLSHRPGPLPEHQSPPSF